MYCCDFSIEHPAGNRWNNAGYQCRYEHPDLIAADGYGGIWGDPYAGMEIKEGTLRVSDFGGDAWKWNAEYLEL